MMENGLEAVIEELKHRKRMGDQVVYIADRTLEALKEATIQASKDDTSEAQRVKASPRSISQADSTESTFVPADPSISISGAKSEPSAKATTPSQKKRAIVQKSVDPPFSLAPIPDEPPQVVLPETSREEQWKWLRERVLNCPVCNAHLRPGKQVVFGDGNIDADIFFCGEAPGSDEEISGIPFVGKAGQLLMKIIAAMGLSRDDVYIGNIMNWRPEMPTPVGNRPPVYKEMQFCLPYLRAQIEVVQPKVIVALGNTAITGLLGPDPKRRLGSIRGKFLEYEGIALMPTYHPSYVLRYGSMQTKRTIWEDMLQVMEKVGLAISEKQQAYFSK